MQLAGVGTLSKSGVGTMLVPDTVLASVANVTIDAGVVKVKRTGFVKTASAPGEIHIADGAQLDLNAPKTSENSLSVAEAIHGKTIYAAGEGPDGKGAIYNSLDVQGNYTGPQLGSVVLTGGALLGSANGRIDMRPLAGSSAATTAATSLLAGGHTLTVGDMGSDGCFCMNGIVYALDQMRVTGRASFERTLDGTITNGVSVGNGAWVQFYGAMVGEGVFFAMEPSATVAFNVASDASVLNGSFTVGAGATVSVACGQNLTLAGAVTNEGAVTQTGANALILAGTLSGGGSLSGAKVRFAGENTCWRMVADDMGFTSKVNVDGVTDATFLAGLKRMEVIYTGTEPEGKVLTICSAEAYGFTKFDAIDLQLSVMDGAGTPIANCWLEVADGLLKIHFAERIPRTAEWTNGSGDGNVTNPENWLCCDEAGQQIHGAVPTNATTVVVGSDCRFVCTNGASLVCGKVSFASGASLAADCDWRGLAGVPFGGTLDLAGHTLTVGSLDGKATLTGGQSEMTGEVRIDVPADAAVTNVSVALLGNLRLVKTGGGTLVAARNGQTYTGGTVVREGVLKPGADSGTTLFGAAHSELTVEKGAQYWDDVYAPWATQSIRFRIAGTGPDGTGAIRTTHVSTGGIKNENKGWLEALTLTDDAEIARDAYAFSLMANNYGYLPLTLNGHTLTFTSDTLTKDPNHPFLLASSLSGTSGDTGSIVVGDNLQFYPYSGKDSDLSNYRFVVTANASYSSGTDANACNLTVSNFVYRSDSGLSQSNRLTTVVGTYAPVSTTSAPKVQLGDATHLSTTLDLSERTTTFDVAFGGGLTFAEGSVVNVRLGERRPKGVERKLLSWTSRPQGVRFVSDDGRYGVVASEDGLYFVSGMTIILK